MFSVVGSRKIYFGALYVSEHHIADIGEKSQKVIKTCKGDIENSDCYIPFGGAKGGINCDPLTMSESELNKVTRRFVEQTKGIIGPTIDIPAPDVNTNAKVMGWIMDEYSKYAGFSPGVVTGKPLELLGSEGRDEATGRGIMVVLDEALKERGKSWQDTRVAVQGFGNVGSNAARLIAEQGAKIVGLGSASEVTVFLQREGIC